MARPSAIDPSITNYTHMIDLIDLQFLGSPHTIASFLVRTGEGPVLVETGPHATFAQLELGLKTHGLAPADIRHVFLTHIHLDHAGAAWDLARRGARIYVHPLGAPHLIDPSRLMSSAGRIYGDQMDQLWGRMEAIPESQVHRPEDGEQITLGEHTFTAWYTPGHAIHHIAWQLDEKVIFTGDVAGVKINGGIVVPPCPPPDIHVEDWQASIARLRSQAPEALYLTHYGKVEKIDEHLNALETRLLDWAEWMRPRFEAGKTVEETVPDFQAYVQKQLEEGGVKGEQLRQYEKANPSFMSVAGLMRYWKKRTQ